MTPLRQWIAVQPIERVESRYLWVPVEQHGEARIGEVMAVGKGVDTKRGVRPLDCVVGERVLYSARVDTYRTQQGEIDLIEEGSVIGIWLSPTPD